MDRAASRREIASGCGPWRFQTSPRTDDVGIADQEERGESAGVLGPSKESGLLRDSRKGSNLIGSFGAERRGNPP